MGVYYDPSQDRIFLAVRTGWYWGLIYDPDLTTYRFYPEAYGYVYLGLYE